MQLAWTVAYHKWSQISQFNGSYNLTPWLPEVSGIGDSTRKQKQLYCLGQASRMMTVRVLKQATSVSIQQACCQKMLSKNVVKITVDHRHSLLSLKDARKHMLALRFCSASDRDMRHNAGVVGFANLSEGQDLTAVGIKKATMKVLRDLCEGVETIPFSDT